MKHVSAVVLTSTVALAIGLAGCKGTTALTPHLRSAAKLTHMYVSHESQSGGVDIYTLPVTSGSTPTGTLAATWPGMLFVDARGRLFVPIGGGSNAGTVQVYTSPVTPSNTAAFSLTVCDNSGFCGSSAPYDEDTAEDSKGNVYVSMASGAQTDYCCIDVFTAEAIGAGVSLSAPSAVVAGNGSATQLDYPYGIAVDGKGNLFASSALSLLEYSLPLPTGTPAPSADVMPSGFSNTYNFGLAIDSQNRVFVPDASGCGSIAVFTEPLTSSPAFTIPIYPGAACGTGFAVSGIAFDGAGNLWATVYGQGEVWEVQAPIGASSTAKKILSGVANAWGIAFGP